MEENKPEDEKKPDEQPKPAEQDEKSALESTPDSTQTDKAIDDAQKAQKSKKGKKGNFFQKITSRLNVYFLAFILLIVIAVIIIFVVSQTANKQAANDAAIESQELTQEAIDSLNSNEATVGDPKQLLNIESNSVFSGSVLVEGGLDVAGPIKVGGALNLPGITVAGQSAFDEVAINTLSVAGDLSVQGQVTVQDGLTVNGATSFSAPISAPSITVDSLDINGDVQFTRHIDAGGGTPGVSAGSAIGSGGTVTISGTDTAGTVTANIGSGAGSGVLATVTFASEFTARPHVVVSPVNRAAPNLYITSRTASGFSIRSDTALPAGSISFDFVVID